MSFWESMKRYPLKATRSPVSLNSIHEKCSCVHKNCLNKKKVVLELPRGSECLCCDLCDVFKKIRNQKKNPDYIIYTAIKGYKTQLVVVETKISVKNDYGVGQIKSGLEVMSERREMFEVRPRPENLLGLLVHGRKKVRISDKVLMDRKDMLRYGGLKGLVRECTYGTCLVKYMIPR